MILDASCNLDYQTTEDVPAIFMLRPRSGWAQWIMREQFHLYPQVPVLEFTDVYGNLCQRTVMPAGHFHLSVQFRVQVPDHVDSDPDAPLSLVQNLPPEVLHFLLPSRYCQSDEMAGLAASVVGGVQPTYQQVEQIRTWIHQNVRYESGTSNSSTTAQETLHTRRGVCRDFAHLGIALCRAINVPARMVVGFLHDLNPMDLHAWFEAFIGGRWFTFDAMEQQTRGNRIVVAYGRDAADVALATMFGSFTLESMQITVKAVNAPFAQRFG
ncbi:transglutaminase domain-containing protein [Prosthecobacter sp.]|uniref:transglutaminase domain-containing protein n=1 Tax=Prosthecobacter sp. TaxID=1965333 RepID=UPI003784F884